MRPESDEELRRLELDRIPKQCTLDTSTWISYLIGGRSVRPLVKALLQSEEWLIVLSDEIEAEVREVLGRPKFATLPGALRLFEQSLPFVVHIKNVPSVVGCCDPDDNMVLACAVASDSSAVISGDTAHLISMGTFRGIPILSAAQFQLRFALPTP